MSNHVFWVMIHLCHLSCDSNMTKSKNCPTPYLFGEFNDKPILLHLDNLIMLSFSTKHAIFMSQSTACNGNQRIGLLTGTRTRFDTCFHVMHKLLHKKKVLKAMIHSPACSGVFHNARAPLTIQDFEDEVFWKAI